jgi:uncharacterized OB-fold protein
MTDERPALWVEREGAVALRCVHCTACGADLFPPQNYGCTACGAHGPHLSEIDLPAEGTLHSYAVVHVHKGKTTPFTVGELALDAGPVLRVRLVDAAAATIGGRLRGVVVDRDGERALEFAALEDAR